MGGERVHVLEKVLDLLLEYFGPLGPLGGTYLNEWEDQAHSEVGEPVDTAPHHVGGRPGGLQEDLGDEQCGDRTWGRRGRAVFPAGRASPQRVLEALPMQGSRGIRPKVEQCASSTPGLVEKQCEKAPSKSRAQQATSCGVPKGGP